MESTVVRLGSKFTFDPDGCWMWRAGLDGHGYGKFWLHGKMRQAYKIVYELLVGPVPEGHELDHLCRKRSCVNPEHLEPVTHAENIRRGASSTARTHCRRGHAFSPENTAYQTCGGRRQRVCRSCRRLSPKEKRHAVSG